MARSLKKGPFVHYKLEKRYRKISLGGNKMWLKLGQEHQ